MRTRLGLQLPFAARLLQSPSHCPTQFTVPVEGVQLPWQLPEQEPVQCSAALASAVQDPEHSTDSCPPVHFGGVAFRSHLALASQCPWQEALASNEAVHCGGSYWTVTLAASVPLAPKRALI